MRSTHTAKTVSYTHLVAANSKSDKIVRKGQFAYNRATTRNGEKISIAYRDGEDCTVSSAYQVFVIKDMSVLNPYFLLLWFSRPEFDRYARYKSEGSAHEFFDYSAMERVEIPLPPIEVQRSVVALYNCAEEARAIAREDVYKRQVKDFPPIRVFGTVGFIATMWFVNCATWHDGNFGFTIGEDLTKFQLTHFQFLVSGVLGVILFAYCMTLPQCKLVKTVGQTLAQQLGLDAFKLFKQKKMALFFIFSMLLGMSLQVTRCV